MSAPLARPVRILGLLGAPGLIVILVLLSLPQLKRWRTLVQLTQEMTRATPVQERLPQLDAALRGIEEGPSPPGLAHALRGALEILREDPDAARKALERFAQHPSPLAASVGRYLEGSQAGVGPDGERPDELARVLDGWRLVRLDDLAPLENLLASRSGRREKSFHELYLEFLLHVRKKPEDLAGARSLLDKLRNQVDRQPNLPHLGFGPDPFDPVVTADPDGTLVLREAPWRGDFLPMRESIRRRKVDVYLAVASLHHASGEPHRSLFQAEILEKNFRDEIDRRGLGGTLDLLLHPRPHRSVIRKAARQYGLDPYMIYAVIREESKFRADAGSHAGAQGLMQIMPATAQWIAHKRGQKGVIGVRDLKQPEVNLDLGAWYLKYLSTKFNDPKNRWKWILAAYNGGLGNASRWLKLFKKRRAKEPGLVPEDVIDFPESRDYVGKVLSSRDRYKQLYTEPEG